MGIDLVNIWNHAEKQGVGVEPRIRRRRHLNVKFTLRSGAANEEGRGLQCVRENTPRIERGTANANEDVRAYVSHEVSAHQFCRRVIGVGRKRRERETRRFNRTYGE